MKFSTASILAPRKTHNLPVTHSIKQSSLGKSRELQSLSLPAMKTTWKLIFLLLIITFSVETHCQHSVTTVAIQSRASPYSCFLMLIINPRKWPQILCKMLFKVNKKHFLIFISSSTSRAKEIIIFHLWYFFTLSHIFIVVYSSVFSSIYSVWVVSS